MTARNSPAVASLHRWGQRFVLAGIRFYQAALRPLNPWGCKFYPSCSDYALEAVERHGLGRGGWAALQRILRCRPGVFGGFDPVPDSLSGFHPPTEVQELGR